MGESETLVPGQVTPIDTPSKYEVNSGTDSQDGPDSSGTPSSPTQADAATMGRAMSGNSKPTAQLGEDIKLAYNKVCALAFVALVLMFVEVELCTHQILDTAGRDAPPAQGRAEYDACVAEDDCDIDEWTEKVGADGSVKNTTVMVALKIGILVAVSLQALFFMRYQKLLYGLTLAKKSAQAMHSTRWKRRAQFMLEILLCLFHSPFWIDQNFHVHTFRSIDYDGPWTTVGEKVLIPFHSDMFAMFMVNRVYLLPRLVLYHSALWSEGSALASLAKMEISVGVAIRAGFTKHPARYLFIFLLFPFAALTFVFSNCERLIDPLYTAYHHAVWSSFVSLTTVGYGTDEAQTLCGRGVSSILIILGITGTSLVISKVQDALHMTPQQQTVMRMIAEKKRDERIMLLSVLAIQKTWKTYKLEMDKKFRREKAEASQRAGRRASITDISTRRMNTAKDLTKSPVVYASLKALAELKSSPLEFDADFTTAMNIEIKEVKNMIKGLKQDQNDLKNQIRKDMAAMQGHLLSTILHEFRDSMGAQHAPPPTTAVPGGTFLGHNGPVRQVGSGGNLNPKTGSGPPVPAP